MVQEEIFGPVVVVLPFDDEDEGVALANGTEFGLNDYVFTGDTARGLRVARQLRSGSVAINTAQQNPEAPFGGFKQSGVGRDRRQLRPRTPTASSSRSCGRAERGGDRDVKGIVWTGELEVRDDVERARPAARTRCGCASSTPGCATATCR